MRTVSDTARAWGVSAECVRLWVKRGLIQSVRLGERATMIVDAEKPKTAPRGRPKKIIAE